MNDRYLEMLAEVFSETIIRASEEMATNQKSDFEISKAQQDCLSYIYLHGPSSVGQIARGMDVSLSAVSQLLDKLVKRGFATRKEDEFDRRQLRAAITCEGEKIVIESRKEKIDWFTSILKQMSAEEIENFKSGLEGFLRIALAKDEDADRACLWCGLDHVASCVVRDVKRSKCDERSL